MTTSDLYAPPAASLAGPAEATGAAERIRLEHLAHEAAVRSIGSLYLLAAFVLGVAALLMLGQGARDAGLLVAGIVYGAIAAASVALAVGLRRLSRWVRVPVGVLSGVGVLLFPIGTLINAYILYLLFGHKGRVVFSPEYEDVVGQTQDLRYRTSRVVVVLAAALLGLILLAIFGVALAA